MEGKGRKGYSKHVEAETETTTGSTRRSEVLFKPIVSSRSTVVNRSSTSSFPGTLRFDSQSRHSFAGIPSQQMTEISSAGVSNFKEERTHEKAELQDLNSRLATYMEKMRYLEAANKALEKELEKQRKIKEVDFDKIKNMYEDELKQARKVLEDMSREKAEVDVKVLSHEDEMATMKQELEQEIRFKEDYCNKAEKFADQIGDYEGEMTSLRLRVDGLEDTVVKLQETIKRLRQENARLRTDLDSETIVHITESNRAQGLEEELQFITQVYEQEIKELQELARRDTTIEMRDFWKGEMGGALREIQAEYDLRLNQITSNLDSKYNVQLSQINSSVNRDTMEINYIKEENKKFKTKISDLNDKNADLMAVNASLVQRNKQLDGMLRDKEEEMNELQQRHEHENANLKANQELLLADMEKLTNAKLSHEMEISAYRKLLESEEDRFDMKSKFESLGGIASSSESSMQSMLRTGGGHGGNASSSESSMQSMMKGGGSYGGQQQSSQDKSEYTGRVTINRTSRAGLSLNEIKSDGSCITITNNPTSFRKRQSYSLTGWTIERYFKDGKQLVYKFPEGFVLDPDRSIHLFSKSSKHRIAEDAHDEKEVEVDNWGTAPADTYLKDENGADKATYKHVVHQ